MEKRVGHKPTQLMTITGQPTHRYGAATREHRLAPRDDWRTIDRNDCRKHRNLVQQNINRHLISKKLITPLSSNQILVVVDTPVARAYEGYKFIICDNGNVQLQVFESLRALTVGRIKKNGGFVPKAQEVLLHGIPVDMSETDDALVGAPSKEAPMCAVDVRVSDLDQLEAGDLSSKCAADLYNKFHMEERQTLSSDDTLFERSRG